MPFLSQGHIDRITKATGELERWIRTLPGLEESDFQTRAASSIARQLNAQVAAWQMECTRLLNLVAKRNNELARARKDHQATILEARRQAARAASAETVVREISEWAIQYASPRAETIISGIIERRRSDLL